ncbi:hypothetical protein WG922_16165 [Ramlibacter sp. AN1015]|uniref:hypothetical protein n=1 Tax=Ramlibacter sp. AN1015 TaxID=3133428 RepID=UPI0030BC4BD4
MPTRQPSDAAATKQVAGEDDADALARWRQWFRQADQALHERGSALEREQAAVCASLQACGLHTPQDIRAAIAAMDATEREALHIAGYGSASARPEPAPAAAPRRSRRRPFI